MGPKRHGQTIDPLQIINIHVWLLFVQSCSLMRPTESAKYPGRMKLAVGIIQIHENLPHRLLTRSDRWHTSLDRCHSLYIVHFLVSQDYSQVQCLCTHTHARTHAPTHTQALTMLKHPHAHLRFLKFPNQKSIPAINVGMFCTLAFKLQLVKSSLTLWNWPIASAPAW